MSSHLVQGDLADGQWHRMHPLTPVLKGGLTLGIIIGVLLYNLRDQAINFFVRIFAPEGADLMYNHSSDDLDTMASEVVSFFEDPAGWILAHNAVWLVIAALIGIFLLLIFGFFLSWRFHMFRITGDLVEVKQGIVFRTQRRAPLDRVQGVNLTRPTIARLVGLAKLEVLGAGADSNVKLEYLTIRSAEQVRQDILRLAAGLQRAERAQTDSRFVDGATEGISEVFSGVADPDVEPTSIVHLSTGMIVGSALASGSTIVLILGTIGVIVAVAFGHWWATFAFIPGLLAFGAVVVSQVVKHLRYSIAPTPDGVRVRRGLLTTETEVLPPGRIHAVQISQGPIWRRFGWASIKINRMSGRSASDTRTDNFTTVLPVGKPLDVVRVLQVLLPGLTYEQAAELAGYGLGTGAEGDGYLITPKSARWMRPLSWRRNGLRTDGSTVLLRQGWMYRTIGIFPLARAQGIALAQGPFGRAANVARLRVCTVAGPVYGGIGALDARALEHIFVEVVEGANAAVKSDNTHRWGEYLSQLVAAGAPLSDAWPAGSVSAAVASAPAVPSPGGDAPELIGTSPEFTDAAPLPPAAAPLPPEAASLPPTVESREDV